MCACASSGSADPEYLARMHARVRTLVAAGFSRSLPDAVQKQLTFRRAPTLEIEYTGDGDGHVLRVIPADGKNVLGAAPTLVMMDERGHRQRDLSFPRPCGLSAKGRFFHSAACTKTFDPADQSPTQSCNCCSDPPPFGPGVGNALKFKRLSNAAQGTGPCRI